MKNVVISLCFLISFAFLQKESVAPKKKNNKDKQTFSNKEDIDKYLDLYDRSFELLKRNYVIKPDKLSVGILKPESVSWASSV